MKNQQTMTCCDGFGTVVLLLVLFITIPLASGCTMFSSISTSAKRMVWDVRSPHGDLKKKIGVAFFENKTSLLNRAAEQQFFNDFIARLKASCSGEIFVIPGDTDYPGHLNELPKNASGWINTLELAGASRQFGFNAIVTGALTNIIKNREKRGFLWFKDIHHFFEIHVSVAVYDTQTGAKLLDESISHEMAVDETEFESATSSTDLLTSITNEAFQHIATEMGELVCDKIVMQPWNGFITSVDPDKVIIASGQTVGIKPGSVFEVYDGGEIFIGSEGQRFFVPGPKTGEIKVTKVFADSAEAVQISGGKILESSFISPK